MRRLLFALVSLGLAASLAAPTQAATGPQPKDVSGLLIPEGLVAETGGSAPSVGRIIEPSLRQAKGQVSVVVQLKSAPLAVQNGAGFKQLSRMGAARVTPADQRTHLATISAEQTAFVNQAAALGAREIARFSRALNAVAMKVDAAQIEKLAALPGVVSVRPIVNYELDLSETVPYIGAKAVQDAGFDGSGVVVAVLDSGIDYTHAKLGGAGTLAAYEAAYGASPSDPRNTTRDGLFPTAKVVEGYDFVGEVWPRGPNGFGDEDLAPDPDPIDFQGHGTHVADIIAGNDMARVRVVHASPDAPAVDILVNGAPAITNLAFGQISGYASLAPGTYNIKVVPAGATTPVVFDADVPLAEGVDLTVVAKGLLGDSSFGVLPLTDNNKPTADKARIRFVHASPNAPAVDIAVAGGPVLFGNVAFGEVGDYIEVPGGTYDLEVRLAGTSTVVLSLPGIAVANGKTYTAYAVGLAGGTPALGAILSVDDPSPTGKGVAPGAKLVAIKVCSAVSGSCSGLALLNGVEFALDPNGDGDLSDAVDVMNLSLGLSYGQKEDDLSFALGNAVHLGVVVVASAGNSADRPYITGSPSTQPEVISVAQTAVPSAKTFPLVINSPASIAGIVRNTNTVEWAPIGNGFTGDVVYVGRGCPAGSITGTNPDDPYLANPAGKVALILRGACAVSLKVDRATKAGAIAVLIQNNVSGDPPSFSFGGGDLPMVPTLIITLQDGNTIRAALAAGNVVNVSVSDAVSIPLVGSMVASSSRGPSYSYNAIKPEIGAPGASISAIAGSGTGIEAFGGTSGAAPMVSGSAALVLQAHPDYSPRDVKAVLVNTADANILINPATQPGVLAPITRIGGGEVRVNRAVATKTAAWSASDDNPAISFGYRAVTGTSTFRRRIMVRNYSDYARTYTITPGFRYANDAASGAVTPSAPATIRVPANSTRSFVLELTVDSTKLPTWPWTFFGGSNSGTGALLQTVEFDGYLTISDDTDTIHLPWHILPRKAAEVRATPNRLRFPNNTTLTLSNSTVNDAEVDVFSLTGVSPRISRGALPGPGYNYTLIDLAATGVRPALVSSSAGPLQAVQFAIATFGNRAHPNYPAEFDIYIDVDRVHNDTEGFGEFEYVLYNSELGGFAATGQCVVNLLNLDTLQQVTRFFCDADLNSGNMIFTALLGDMGLSFDKMFSFYVYAYDNYFTGNLTDAIHQQTVQLDTLPVYPDAAALTVPAGGSATLMAGKNDIWTEPPSQTNGLLLIYRDAPPGREFQIIRSN